MNVRPSDINPLQPSVAFPYPLKTSENLVFSGYRKATTACNGLISLRHILFKFQALKRSPVQINGSVTKIWNL